MKLLHLSRRANKESILTNGILPSYIKLDAHYECFKNFGLEDRKCVYTWNPDVGQSTEKYVRDMIYCKLFIHPRNEICDREDVRNQKLWDEGKIMDWDDDKHWTDFSKLGKKLFGSDDVYDLYEIDIEETHPLLLDGWFTHGQEKSDWKRGSCHLLDDYYAHDDKTLYISKDIITPDKLKIVESVNARVYANNTLGITHKKIL